MPFCLQPKRGREDPREVKNESLFLRHFDRFGDDRLANVKCEILGPRTRSTHNLLISFSQCPYR